MSTTLRRSTLLLAVSAAIVASPASVPVAQGSEPGPPGDLWGWGRNDGAQIGNGCDGFSDILRPERNETLTDVTLITEGPLALRSDGQLWAWGGNYNGTVGDGTQIDRCEPVMVPGMDKVVAISGGHQYSHAIRESGRVWAWGDNEWGELGIGTRIDSLSPVRVPHLKHAVAVDHGPDHALALKANGTVKAWGNNAYGQLGDGTRNWQPRPRKVPGLTDVVAISAGGTDEGIWPAFGFSLALRADGTVWAWGNNHYGNLGDGTLVDRWVPTQVADIDGVTALSAGGFFSLALRDDGTAWAWGENHDGQLGDGTTRPQLTPQQVPGIEDLVDVSAGHEYAVALRSDGIAFAWGNNFYGQVGNGNSDTPVVEPSQVVDLTGITAVAAGLQTTWAVAGTPD